MVKNVNKKNIVFLIFLSFFGINAFCQKKEKAEILETLFNDSYGLQRIFSKIREDNYAIINREKFQESINETTKNRETVTHSFIIDTDSLGRIDDIIFNKEFYDVYSQEAIKEIYYLWNQYLRFNFTFKQNVSYSRLYFFIYFTYFNEKGYYISNINRTKININKRRTYIKKGKKGRKVFIFKDNIIRMSFLPVTIDRR